GAHYQARSPPATIDARCLWQAADGEIIIVRNGGTFGSLVPTFEARVDGPYAYLNEGLYLSSNPAVGQGGVALTFYESSGSGESTPSGESTGSSESTPSGESTGSGETAGAGDSTDGARRARPAGGQ